METTKLNRFGGLAVKLLLVLALGAAFTNMQMRADCCPSQPSQITLRPVAAVKSGQGGSSIAFDVATDCEATVHEFTAGVVAYGRDGRQLGEFLLRGGTVHPGVINSAEMTIDVNVSEISSLEVSLVSLDDDCGRDAENYRISLRK